jgi:hypothetical protein
VGLKEIFLRLSSPIMNSSVSSANLDVDEASRPEDSTPETDVPVEYSKGLISEPNGSSSSSVTEETQNDVNAIENVEDSSASAGGEGQGGNSTEETDSAPTPRAKKYPPLQFDPTTYDKSPSHSPRPGVRKKVDKPLYKQRTKYLLKHPELAIITQCFQNEVIRHKPDDIVAFAIDKFFVEDPPNAALTEALRILNAK